MVNHQKYWMFGAALVNNPLHELVLNAIDDKAFVTNAFPMLCDWGVKDEDTLIHSLGCSYWMQLGHHLGYSGVVEVPAPLTYALRVNHDVRSDAVWFSYQDKQPKLVVEFERYGGTSSDRNKLEGKVKNLLLAYLRWSCAPEIIVLAYWTIGLKTLPNHQKLKKIYADGFDFGSGEYIKGANPSRLMFMNFVFEMGNDNLYRLVSVIPRG